MPRVSVYPEWVHKLCPPGHSVKRKGDKYYLYKTTSKMVPGFKNPQPQSKYVGVITPDGIQYSSRRLINTDEHPDWYEYGLSKCIYDRCYDILLKEFKDDGLAKNVSLNVIKELSPRSYLLKDAVIDAPEDLHVCVCNQIRKIEGKLKLRFKDLEILKDIHLVELNKKRIITAVNDEQQELIDQLGVDIYG